MFVDIEDGKVISKEILDNPGYIHHQPGQVPAFIKSHGADWLVAGGAGPMAVQLLQQGGVKVVLGISGPVDEVIQKILDGTLEGGESLCEHVHMSPEEHRHHHEQVHGDE